MFEHPTADFGELISLTPHRTMTKEEIKESLDAASVAFKPRRKRTNAEDMRNYLLGSVRPQAAGNAAFTELATANNR